MLVECCGFGGTQSRATQQEEIEEAWLNLVEKANLPPSLSPRKTLTARRAIRREKRPPCRAHALDELAAGDRLAFCIE